MEKFIKQNTDNPNASYYPKGELVISKDYLKGTKSFRLSWKFIISSLQPNNEQLIFIDAITGEVINSRSLIYDANTPCTAQTRYSDTLGITGDSFNGGFRLRENRNGVDILTLNLQNNSNYASATDFTNTNTNFINGNWANFNQDQVAVDAHWGAESVLDFWQTLFNRNSLNGNGLAITSYVHNPIGGNAYWDGNANVMNYGDGDGVNFRPLTALDVCAHEMGHGICEFTANVSQGTNGRQEADALNEGLSDIWGACVEHRAAPNKQTWLIGEEVMANGSPCLRSLINPKTGGWSGGSSTGGFPNTYLGQYWDNGGEPHTNSTVLSHWFYFLSQGGAGTNDIGNSYSVRGIGIDRASQIVYQAESAPYLHPGSNYTDARNAMIQAARDINGGVSGSCDEIAVTNAWYAVGVGTAFPSSITVSGPSSICYNNSAQYTISANSSLNGIPVTWRVSDPNMATIVVAPDGLSATVTNISSTTTMTSVIASISNSSNCSVSSSLNVALGAPFVSGTYTNTFNGSNNYLGYYPNITNPACTGYYINTNMR